MAVESTFKLANAELTNFTMITTMPLRDWKRLRGLLDNTSEQGAEPFFTLRHQIYALVNFAEKHFQESRETEVKEES